MSSILVVEGEGFISRLLNDEFASEEYHTVGVLNGDDAVQFALREVPLLIIFNLSFVSGNAYEAIRRLRSHPKSMHIPIIMLSSSSSVALKVRALEAGVDHYIYNPAAGGYLSPDVADELQLPELGQRLEVLHTGVRDQPCGEVCEPDFLEVGQRFEVYQHAVGA